jgi:hypothetical protein
MKEPLREISPTVFRPRPDADVADSLAAVFGEPASQPRGRRGKPANGPPGDRFRYFF